MRKKVHNKKTLSLFVAAIIAIVLILSVIAPISITASTDQASIITDFSINQYSLSFETTNKELSDAATSNFNYLVTGIIILILAAAFFAASRKR